MSSYKPVTALMRGLKVLEALNTLGAASLLKLHQDTRLPKSTIVRILATLSYAGYVEQAHLGATYSPTAKARTLSQGPDGGIDAGFSQPAGGLRHPAGAGKRYQQRKERERSQATP